MAIREYKDRLFKNGKPIPGVLARLYNEDNVLCGSVSSDWRGAYGFKNILPGNYQIRFFGEDFTEEDWIYITVTGTAEELVPPIEFAGIPKLQVSENRAEVDLLGETSGVNLIFSDLDTSKGSIKTILVEYKGDEGWKPLPTLSFDPALPEVTPDSKSATFLRNVVLEYKPIYYDFRASFFNGDGKVATHPPAVGGGVVYAHGEGVLFTGVTPLNEYVGVKNLYVKNERVINQVMGLSRIPTNELILKWDDPATPTSGGGGEGEVFYDAAGKAVIPTPEQKRTIVRYVVYMFVSTHGDPPMAGDYPVSEGEENGNWYLLMKVAKETPYCNVRVPQKRNIKLWVGFETEDTNSAATDEPFIYKL